MDRSDRLRILHIILAITPTNEQYNEQCLPLMHQREISICTYFKSKITPPPYITLFDGDSSLMGFFRTLHAALKVKEYDVIHVHTPHAGLLLLLVLFFTGKYRKLIDLSVHTVQNSYSNFKLRNKLLFLPSFAFFRRIVFCSHSSSKSFPAFYRWLARGRIHVVQNAVDLKRIDRAIAAAPTPQERSFTVVAVGLIPIKNPFTVLEAFSLSSNKNDRLVYLGEGKLVPLLTREIEKRGLREQVLLTGMVPRDCVFEWFSHADLFVSASYGEGLPVAVMEAMACRCPVILSDIPPHREIAGKSGCIPLIQPDDVASFAQAIQRYREMPAEERAGIGQDCRKLIENQFSLSAMSSGYAEVYSQIVHRPVEFFPEEIH